MRRGRGIRHRAWAACALAATAAVTGAVPSSATVRERERYEFTRTSTFTECEFSLNRVFSMSGHYLVRETRDGEAFLALDRWSYRSVLTNPETGKWFAVRGHAVSNEIKATHVDGTVYEFRSVEAGQPFVIEDADGRVIVRDRGSIGFTFLFDTFGDGEPGGEMLEESAVVHGPHPGFADDFPFCEIAARLTGAG